MNGQAKTFVKEVHMRGFKSFNKKNEVSLGQSMNCVIGPNGAGKSNVCDAICFILGRLSSKDLRAENFSDLVFKKKGTKQLGGGVAEVSMILDNVNKVFPVETDSVSIKRIIKKTGQTQYKLNGKNATRQQILELLSAARIFPDGHNIILQGDIARFVDMNTVTRRKLVEEVSGIGIYEERKEKAMLSLEKVGEKIKEAKIVLNEKEIHMHELEKEKKEAEKYRTIKDSLQIARASEIHLRLKNAEERVASLDASIIDKENHINQIKEKMGTQQTKIDDIKKQIAEIETIIEQKGGEDAAKLQKEIEVLKHDLQASLNILSSSKNEISRIDMRQSQLKNNLLDVESKIKEAESERSKLNSELSEVQKKEDELAKSKDLMSLKDMTDELNKIERTLENLRVAESQTSADIHNKKSEVKLVELEIKTIEDKIKDLEKQAEKFSVNEAGELNYKQLIDNINKLTARDSAIALELGEIKKENIQIEEELAKSRVHAASSHELLLRDNAIKIIFAEKIKGVLGTVAELGNVGREYAMALQVAAGARMKNIVVETSDVAIGCLRTLKESKAGIATFLPLDKLKVPAVDEEAEKLKAQGGVVGFAFDLISSDKKYKNLFKYIFGYTLIVDSVETAKAIGVSKCRMVTLEGDLFEKSGAITGGFRQKGLGVGFEQKELAGFLKSQESRSAELKVKEHMLENERRELENSLMDFRKKKAELEGKAEIVKEIKKVLKDRDRLFEDIKLLTEKKKECETAEKEFNKKLNSLADEIKETLTRKEEITSNLRTLQLGKRNKDFDIIADQKRDLTATLAAIDATLANALKPEYDNMTRVVKQLEKERKEFESQITKEEKSSQKLQKDLETKEKEEQSFFGKLKSLFAKKHKLNEDLHADEQKNTEHIIKTKTMEQERNIAAVEKAKFVAESQKIKEEQKEFENIQISEEYKTLEAVRKSIREYSNKIERLGNVNLRALEVFEKIKEEYDVLASKVSTLELEQKGILDIIAEIETKKKGAFITTFEKLATSFQEIFLKTNSGSKDNTSELFLENPDNPFEAGVAVAVKDNKGKQMSLASLSGGEKVIVALSFIFAIQEFDPAPFYLLDEVDAALDKINSEKVSKLLKDYSGKSQVIIITHNDAVVTAADQIYGVSMNKEGESKVVSIKV